MTISARSLIAFVLLLGLGWPRPGGSTTAVAQTPEISRVSIASDGTEANDGSETPSISGDGRYVAFASYAGNLVSGDTNGARDVFVHDRDMGQTERVSVSSAGAQGNMESLWPSISSADGRYVAFASGANNLVAGDSNNQRDIFVHDRDTGQTTRVSVTSGGEEGNDSSQEPFLSADGRYVAFTSAASDLVSGDTNLEKDIFLHDRDADSNGVFDEAGGINTVRVSVHSNGTEGNGESSLSYLSADGRYVAFASAASTLVDGDTNAAQDIFVHDRPTGQTVRVSIDSNSLEANDDSRKPSLSDDGRYVAFRSEASDLVSGDTNNQTDIFLHDRDADGDSLFDEPGQVSTVRVSVASDGTEGNGPSFDPAISADGRYVAFSSSAFNLVAGDTNSFRDVFVHDRQTLQTTRVSVVSDGAEGDGDSREPTLGSGASLVAFSSLATNLVSEDTNCVQDIFVHDQAAAGSSPTSSNLCVGLYLPLILNSP